LVTISLRQSNAGTWLVRRCQISLFSDLTLGSAISLAREVARDEHQRTGHEVRVEMPGPNFAITLAHYAVGGVTKAPTAMAA
jgi:hypothetical protein